MVDTALQLEKEKIFEGIEESKGNLPNWMQFTEQAMECYKLEESKLEDLEPREVHIQETKGERAVPGLENSRSYSEPLKIIKVNIGTTEVPKFASIGDYWDEQTMCKILICCMSIMTYFPLSSQK